MAVNSVTKTIYLETTGNVDLKNMRIIKSLGGKIEDSESVDGLVWTQRVLKNASSPIRMEKAKIGLIWTTELGRDGVQIPGCTQRHLGTRNEEGKCESHIYFLNNSTPYTELHLT